MKRTEKNASTNQNKPNGDKTMKTSQQIYAERLATIKETMNLLAAELKDTEAQAKKGNIPLGEFDRVQSLLIEAAYYLQTKNVKVPKSLEAAAEAAGIEL